MIHLGVSMTREELLDEINEKLEEEHADNTITEKGALVDSGVDSFGLTMTLVDISNKYEIYPKEEFRNINFAKITAKDVIDKIMSKHGTN